MTAPEPDRDPLFLEVDAVLEILADAARKESVSLPVRRWRERHVEAVDHAAAQAGHWERTVTRLLPYSKASLECVAQLLRTREGQLARRGQLWFGSAKGSGLLGVALAVLALSAFWNTAKVWFPHLSLGWLLYGFGLMALVLGGVSWIFLGAVHGAGHLLFTAEMVDAAVKLKEADLTSRVTQVSETVEVER